MHVLRRIRATAPEGHDVIRHVSGKREQRRSGVARA
jgi:hypothetical protein